jgi:hypothetical protein
VLRKSHPSHPPQMLVAPCKTNFMPTLRTRPRPLYPSRQVCCGHEQVGRFTSAWERNRITTERRPRHGWSRPIATTSRAPATGFEPGPHTPNRRGLDADVVRTPPGPFNPLKVRPIGLTAAFAGIAASSVRFPLCRGVQPRPFPLPLQSPQLSAMVVRLQVPWHRYITRPWKIGSSRSSSPHWR